MTERSVNNLAKANIGDYAELCPMVWNVNSAVHNWVPIPCNTPGVILLIIIPDPRCPVPSPSRQVSSRPGRPVGECAAESREAELGERTQNSEWATERILSQAEMEEDPSYLPPPGAESPDTSPAQDRDRERWDLSSANIVNIGQQWACSECPESQVMTVCLLFAYLLILCDKLTIMSTDR